MEIDPKYKSPRKRQKKKIDFARKLLPIFERCRNELGSYAAQNEIAQWMNDHEVPTKDGRRTYQWTSDTVGGYLNFDGLEPTPENVAAPKTKNEGMRVSITRACRRDAPAGAPIASRHRGDSKHRLQGQRRRLASTRCVPTRGSPGAATSRPLHSRRWLSDPVQGHALDHGPRVRAPRVHGREH